MFRTCILAATWINICMTMVQPMDSCCFHLNALTTCWGHTTNTISPHSLRHFMNKCTTLDLVHDLADDLHTTFFRNSLTSATKRASGGVQNTFDIMEVTRARLPLQRGSIQGHILYMVTRFRRSSSILSLCT